MIKYKADFEYIESNGIKLFTVVLLPDSNGKFPVVIYRSPYVNRYDNESEEDIAVEYLNLYKNWLKRGYAVVFQHCRGKGKSEGEFEPVVNEREDGLNLQRWIREQSFYNGEIYLNGISYLTTVHYSTAPFANDIKGAVFGVQDTEVYNWYYRNGFYKKGLIGTWFVSVYNAKTQLKKSYTEGAFDMLPLKDFSKTVFGEAVKNFDDILKAPDYKDELWSTKVGGSDVRNATDNVHFPVLFATGFYDIYTGGIFEMWRKMSENSRNMSALVVSPYDHNDKFDPEESIMFPDGKIREKFGEFYEMDWFDYIRGKIDTSPFEQGKITHYNLFKNEWETAKFLEHSDTMKIRFGNDEISYVYNPFDAPRFKGGLSRAFGGAVYQDKPNSRHDIISLYSKPFEKDVEVKGKMSAKLSVKSDCEDTCFYVRISIEKEKGDYGLRDDITSLCYQLGDYEPNSVVWLDFDFDEHAFLIKKGERLRIDISSANNEHYVRHTNQKGLYSEQTTAKVAHNTVYLEKSFLVLPIDK